MNRFYRKRSHVHQRLDYSGGHGSVYKSVLISGMVLLGVGAADAGTIAVLQTSPHMQVALANRINYQTNGSGKVKKQTIYQGLNLAKLTPEQKQQVSFKDNSYVSDSSQITKDLADTSGLFLQGYVAVPSVKIYQPIYYGTSDKVLAHGAGSAKDGQVMGQGNYAISAHNMGQYVNWQTAVPAAGGGYIHPGNYFTPLQTKIPDYIYLSDGQKIYTYKQASRFVTNVGNSNVLADDFPYLNKKFLYQQRNAQQAETGIVDGEPGLNLKANNINKKVDQQKLSKVVTHGKGSYSLLIKAPDNRYSKYMNKNNFKLQLKVDNMTIPGAGLKITDVKPENGQLKISFKTTGDIDDALSTSGARIVVKQLEDNSFVTLTTCFVDASGDSSSDRIIDTGTLVKVESFNQANPKIQKLFPNLLKTKVVVKTDHAQSVDVAKLSLWQQIKYHVGSFFIQQSDWISAKRVGK